MKLTSLTIAPSISYAPVSAKNPLRAVVRLDSDNSTVECVLSEESMRKMLDLCAAEIAEQAKAQVEQFAAAVTAIEGNAGVALIGGDA